MCQVEKETYRRTFHVQGGDYYRGGAVSSEVKSLLILAGLPPQFIRRVTIALYEAEMNVVIHAYEGDVNFELNPEAIKIVLDDRGPGIENIELAMQEGYSTASEEARLMGFGAGMGLSNIKKNADMLRIESEPGKGTKVSIYFDLKAL
jgi:serine/threonine-protein kinase RsbT